MWSLHHFLCISDEANTQLLRTKMRFMYSAATMARACWMIWFDSMWKTNRGEERSPQECHLHHAIITRPLCTAVPCSSLEVTQETFTQIPISRIRTICMSINFNRLIGLNGNSREGKSNLNRKSLLMVNFLIFNSSLPFLQNTCSSERTRCSRIR